MSSKFLLTHPVWDVTILECTSKLKAERFLLTHPVWDVTADKRKYGYVSAFLLTHPVWDVTQKSAGHLNRSGFLLTHPVWDVTRLTVQSWVVWTISTHTSRVGCDLKPQKRLESNRDFYSHIPCGM